MTPAESELLVAFECHDPVRIEAALAAGLSPLAPIDGKPPLDWLVEMYTRSDAFPACLRCLLEHGATLPDARLAAVLLNDPAALRAALAGHPTPFADRFTLRSTFTPLVGASLLHVAAEYGHLAAARGLLEAGAEVDARAAVDGFGLGGHTPLFHTVNSNANRSTPVMQLLLDAGARPDVFVPGFTWGEGFEWETTFFDLTPISYAQLGLLPQVHRNELDITANVRQLLAAAGRPVPPLANVPNRYLAPRVG